ncbi:MAG: hypothetical protein Q4D98_01480 [Planctomycetia bacterium]|nr:hypothetical protein [Planctomycetia bacterium]
MKMARRMFWLWVLSGAFVFAETPESGACLSREVQATLKKWNQAPAADAEAAAKEFLVLYERLKADAVLPEKDRKKMTTIVRNRLASLSRQIEKNLKETPQSVKKATETPPILAQQQPIAGGGNGTAERTSQLSQANGEVLVEIIQETIRPDTWDSRGGNGAIRYWNNKQFLIIRQTDPVHEEVEGLLQQLRRAGG